MHTVRRLAQPRREGKRDMTFRELLVAVAVAGGYETDAEAEEVTRAVLAALGAHVTGEERVALARSLPEEAARTIADEIPLEQPLDAPGFAAAVAARLPGATPATARWHIGSVLTVIGNVVGDDLVTRILSRLPRGYALLFGRAELTWAA